VAKVAGVTTGEGELTGTGAEPEGAAAADAEVAGLVPAAGFAGLVWAVRLGVVADGDVVGTGTGEAGVGVAAGDAVVAGVTITSAAGDGLTSR
jgi:hypothetical protein